MRLYTEDLGSFPYTNSNGVVLVISLFDEFIESSIKGIVETHTISEFASKIWP